MAERGELGGLVSAKLAIAEIQGNTTCGFSGEEVFKAINDRLNELILEEVERLKSKRESEIVYAK